MIAFSWVRFLNFIFVLQAMRFSEAELNIEKIIASTVCTVQRGKFQVSWASLPGTYPF